MTKLLTKMVLGATLGATALTVAAPADAQRYRYHNRDRAGPAIVAGIAGLAIGAAIASNANDRYARDAYYRDRGFRYDYDEFYHRQRGYYPTDGYYYDRYSRGGWNNCRVERRWDPYYRRNVRVQVCY